VYRTCTGTALRNLFAADEPSDFDSRQPREDRKHQRGATAAQQGFAWLVTLSTPAPKYTAFAPPPWAMAWRTVLPATLGLLVLAGRAHAHGLLTIPAPRAGTNQAGANKNSNTPCGSNTATKGASSATLQAGATSTIEWNFGAAHAGPCTIKIAGGADGSTGAPDFTTVQTVTGGDIQQCNTVTSATVTVPAGLPAGPAILQWHWQGDGSYDNCADVTIAGGAAASAASAAQQVDQPDYGEVQVTFAGTAGVSDTDSWKAGVVAVIAKHTGIDANRVEIVSITAGSMVVLFRLWDAPDGVDVAVDADEAVDRLDEQLQCKDGYSCDGIMSSAEFQCCYEGHHVMKGGGASAKTVILVVIVLVACGAGLLGLGMLVMRQRRRQAQQDAKSGRWEPDQSAGAPAVSSRPGEDPKGDSVPADVETSSTGDASMLQRVRSAGTRFVGSVQSKLRKAPPPALPPSSIAGGGRTGNAAARWGTLRGATVTAGAFASSSSGRKPPPPIPRPTPVARPAPSLDTLSPESGQPQAKAQAPPLAAMQRALPARSATPPRPMPAKAAAAGADGGQRRPKTPERPTPPRLSKPAVVAAQAGRALPTRP
jgi:predicted carbohydrate-binding protein with CBM5 and CBM33 domain